MLTYIKIDLPLLKELDPEIKQRLETRLLSIYQNAIVRGYFGKISDGQNNIGIDELFSRNFIQSYITLCPYCNKSGFLCSVNPNPQTEEIDPIRCMFCGETNPYDKIEVSLSKVHKLMTFANKLVGEDNDLENASTIRILLEQCVVNLATGIEILLKDVYCSTLNFRNVKRGHSLFNLFSKVARSQFLNIGKANREFEKDLNIVLKDIIGDQGFGKLNLLLLKRNTIVHNNGFMDSDFISQSGLDYRLNEEVTITIDEIDDNILITQRLINEIGKIFRQELRTEIITRFEELERMAVIGAA